MRLPQNIVARHLGKDAPPFEYGGQKYRFQQLGSFVGLGRHARCPKRDVSMSVVLIRAGEHSTALVTDELVGSREIVVKSLGPQISGDPRHRRRDHPGRRPHRHHSRHGLAGALGVARAAARHRRCSDQRDRRTFALVVDDSITVRRVTQRLLERNGMRVLTAQGRRGRGVAAAGEHAGHHSAGHRDAAHGRLRGGRARAQRSAAEATFRSS